MCPRLKTKNKHRKSPKREVGTCFLFRTSHIARKLETQVKFNGTEPPQPFQVQIAKSDKLTKRERLKRRRRPSMIVQKRTPHQTENSNNAHTLCVCALNLFAQHFRQCFSFSHSIWSICFRFSASCLLVRILQRTKRKKYCEKMFPCLLLLWVVYFVCEIINRLFSRMLM